MQRKKKNQSQTDESEVQNENQSEENSVKIFEKKLTYPTYDLSKTYLQNKKAILAAKDLYFKNFTFESIFIYTELPVILYRRLQPKWDKERKAIEKQLLEKIRSESCAERCKEFLDLGLEVGLTFLKRLISRGDEISVKDFKLAMDAVQAIHRMKQLEEGKATSIEHYENLSPDQLKVYILSVQEQLQRKHGDILIPPIDAEDFNKEEALVMQKRELLNEQ